MKKPLLALFIGIITLFIGFIGGSALFSIGDSWINSTGYITPNSSWSDNVNITGTLTVAGSQVCTATNGLCAGGSADNTSWNETKANTLYYPITNIFGFYNSSNPPPAGGDGTGGWTNTSTTTSTSLTVNLTGALCLGAEGHSVAPCRVGWGDQENQRRYMSIQLDPFLVCGLETGEYGHWGWISVLAGTGGDITCVAAPDETALGTISIGTGTLFNSNVTLTTGTTANAGLWVNDSTGLSGWFARLRIASLSDGTQGYALQAGFSDATAAASYFPTDAIMIFYNGTVAGGTGNWTIVTANNNFRTFTDTNVSVQINKWYDIECQSYNASTVACYINGQLAGTTSSNIPSGSARAFEPGLIRTNKLVGTTERRIYMDYYGVYRVFNQPRW